MCYCNNLEPAELPSRSKSVEITGGVWEDCNPAPCFWFYGKPLVLFLRDAGSQLSMLLRTVS